MPKVIISNNKGLESIAGSGFTLNSNATINSPGFESIKYSDSTTLTNYDGGTGHTDLSVDLPAYALITDMGLICDEKVDTDGASNSQLAADFGTAAGGEQYVASVNITAANEDIELSRSQSVVAANKFAAASAVFATFKHTKALYHTAAATVHGRVSVKTAALTAPGKMRMFVKYIVIS